MTGGEWALLIAAIAWAVLVVFLAIVLANLSRVLDSARTMIDGVHQETIPLLTEVTTSVKKVNRELDRVDPLLASAANITRSIERLTAVLERLLASPLIKAAAVGAGVTRAIRRFRGEK
ncbi:MAG TPA: DUF948 domain-containing protein [Actinomycetota bacterium]|nr:DUF948 domain-containing protein [Actinomycetota bacterium]